MQEQLSVQNSVAVKEEKTKWSSEAFAGHT
jgi:hypothetical protein